MIIKPINIVPKNIYKNFNCGISPINNYLKNTALKNHNENISGSYLVFDDENNCLGFYSLKTIYFNSLDKSIRDKYLYSINIEFIAVIKEMQNNGIGTHLLEFIIKDIKEISKKIGIRFLTLNSKDNKIEWYIKRGFKSIKGHITNLMYLDFLDERGD